MHEALSLATMVALAVHALALLGDGYLKPSLADVTIPFVALRAVWIGARHRRRLDVRHPRPLLLRARPDRPAALAQAAPLHRAGLGARRRARAGEGTDAGAAWFLLAAALVVIPAAALLVRRCTPAVAT